MVADWRGKVADLHQTTIAWIANAPSRILPAVQGWNGPFIDYLCQKSGHSDPTLVHDLQHGFPMIGSIPPYGISARTKLTVDTTGPNVKEVWSSRKVSNHKLVQEIAEDVNSEEIFNAVLEEVTLGAM